MSRNCSFDVHINIRCKKCTDLSGWILRTFTSRDSTTLMALLNALILSRLDYCSQLWSTHLIRHINRIEKIQRSFTKFITGMRDCSYIDRLSLLRLYSLQRRRERYCIIYVWKHNRGFGTKFFKTKQVNNTRHPLHGHTAPKKHLKSRSSFMHDTDKLIDSPFTRRIELWSNHLQSVPHKLMQTHREYLTSGAFSTWLEWN